MERNQRRPPDVNEALSSMLWTPYERTPSDSSLSDDDDEKLNAKLKKSKSTFDYAFPTKTQYVPSFSKIQRYDNFRFSYPYYGPIPIVQKSVTELPSYESLYVQTTPELSNIAGIHGRMVHSFTDNFITQSRPSSMAMCDTAGGPTILAITSSMSGFSNNFTDEDDPDDEDYDDDDFEEPLLAAAAAGGNNNVVIATKSQSTIDDVQLATSSIHQQLLLHSSNGFGVFQSSSSSMETKEAATTTTTVQQHWCSSSSMGQTDSVQSDNNGDLLKVTKSVGSAERQLLRKQNQQQQQQQLYTQLDLKSSTVLLQTITSCQDVAVAIGDLPGKVRVSQPDDHQSDSGFSAAAADFSRSCAAQTADISSTSSSSATTLPVVTQPPPKTATLPVALCSNYSNNNNTDVGEKPDTKCVRSVQTDPVANLKFSSLRLVEDDVSVSLVLSESIAFNASSADRNVNASFGESVDFARNDRPRQQDPLILTAMRLNIPAATPAITDPLKGGTAISNNTISSADNPTNGISTTSVFLPLNESIANSSGARGRILNTNLGAIVNTNEIIQTSATTPGAIVQTIKPSLTIQVNQNSDSRVAGVAHEGHQYHHHRHHQLGHQQNDIVNKTTGISVVSCYSGSTTVPNSCSVNSSSSVVPNVVSTTATTTTTSSLSSAGNNVNVTTTSGLLSECDKSVVQTQGLSTSTTTTATVSDQSQSDQLPELHHHRPLTRTFTSTECQTDDLPLVDRNDISVSSISAAIAQSQTEALISREQRRRERRERRQLGRNRHPHILPPMHPQPPPPPPIIRPNMLPDILHSHFPPPYTALSSLGNPPPPPPPPAGLITPVISTVPMTTATALNDGRFTIPLPVIRRSPSERSGKGCCGQWFAGPPLRALIAVVALGGVACALGGAALGATGLAGPPSSHLTAALLMIGVGVILVTVSGAAWRMTAPGGPPCLGLGSTVDLARCGRRPCNSRGAPHGLLYPEFQHRPPPPSYQASMQEYRLRLLLLDRDRQNGVVRGGSPPPTYRSHAGSLLRTPLSTTTRNVCGATGSEYSLPPSYRSRHPNTNTNTIPSIVRPPSATVISGESIVESNNNNHNINRNSNSTTSNRTGTLIGQLQSLISSVPEIPSLSSASSPPVTFQSSSTTTVTSTRTIARTGTGTATTATQSTNTTQTTATKDSVHTIAIDAAAGATTMSTSSSSSSAPINELSKIQSQNINEKFNPRVTNSNNNNNNHNNNRISNCSSSSGSVSCINAISPTMMMMMKSSVNSLQSATMTTTLATPTPPSAPCPTNSRKELVTIVTISAEPSQSAIQTQSEMEILAHL